MWEIRNNVSWREDSEIMRCGKWRDGARICRFGCDCGYGTMAYHSFDVDLIVTSIIHVMT